MDGPKDIGIDKTQARLRSYSLGSTSDVQAQYPVRISAAAVIGGHEIHWERSLTTAKGKGKPNTKEAKEILSIAADYQERLREGDSSLVLPILACYGTGRLWEYRREKQNDIFETSTRTNGYIGSQAGSTSLKLMVNWFA